VPHVDFMRIARRVAKWFSVTMLLLCTVSLALCYIVTGMGHGVLRWGEWVPLYLFFGYMLWYSTARRGRWLSFLLGIMACASGVGMLAISKGSGDAYWIWLTGVLLLVVFWCADLFVFFRQHGDA
jgi:hypothetical protein